MHLYLHIPFCRQACHYCNFHFSTSLAAFQDMTEAIKKELVLQKNVLIGAPLKTIYFGGGTPSLLSAIQLNDILNTIYKNYQVADNAEITLEGNPDDLTDEYINDLKIAGINRLSIGIQTFNPEMLKYLNRAHNAYQAERSVKFAQDKGITDISVDLIYALPATDHKLLEYDLTKLISLQTPHLSAYCLTIEPKTVFGKWAKQKKIAQIEDKFAAQQYEMTVAALEQNGFEQYEISNFARNKTYSRHNTAYWQQVPYLGVGPGAHSFSGSTRQNNIANNAIYIKELKSNQIPATSELLTSIDHYNEYILTGLRTKWGCQISKLQAYTENRFHKIHESNLTLFTKNNWITLDNEVLKLTPSGRLFADHISSELFIIE
jgi:oxygen-independent coproporphyrinogen-3 oxidase